jgi:hypothetical protein
MKTLKYHSANDDAAHTIVKMFSYGKCLMYSALIIIGDFGVNLLTPDDSFRRWTSRARKINLHDLPTKG